MLFADAPARLRPAAHADIPRIVASGTAVALYFAFVGLAISSLTSRRAFAIGGYLAFLIVPTIIGGILADGLENADNLRLFAFAAVPIHAARASTPTRPTIGHPTDTAWALDVARADRRLGAGAVMALPAGRGDERPPAIEFTGVSRWYGDTVAVADVSFAVGPGVTGLLGHNGAGKSTTLKLCAGFTSPSAGAVRIFGVEPRRHPDVYARVGIVPDQSPPWPFLTAREVVAAVRAAAQGRGSGRRRRGRRSRRSA